MRKIDERKRTLGGTLNAKSIERNEAYEAFSAACDEKKAQPKS